MPTEADRFLQPEALTGFGLSASEQPAADQLAIAGSQFGVVFDAESSKFVRSFAAIVYVQMSQLAANSQSVSEPMSVVRPSCCPSCCGGQLTRRVDVVVAYGVFALVCCNLNVSHHSRARMKIVCAQDQTMKSNFREFNRVSGRIVKTNSTIMNLKRSAYHMMAERINGSILFFEASSRDNKQLKKQQQQQDE